MAIANTNLRNGSPVAEQSSQSTAGVERKKQTHFGPTTFLSSDEIRELSRLDSRRMFGALAMDLSIILLAATASEMFRHPLIYLVALMTIGGRFAGIGSVVLHDGVHNLLLKNRVWNDRLGSILSYLVFTPTLVTFSDYRDSHFGHHRATNTEDDPDLLLTESFYKGSRLKTVVAFILSLSGVLFVLGTLQFLLRKWKKQPIGVCALCCSIAAMSLGLYADIYAAKLVLWYWVVPFATWTVSVNHLRLLAEHYPEEEYGRDTVPEVFRTRDILNSWFDQMFVVTRGLNYHLSHHICPQVPFYNLPRLQRKLAGSPTYQKYAHVTRGYHRVLAEYFFAAEVA